jgi:peptidoglycan/xylan/chitin deacetylase (PgdA/CDA1 family)
MLMSPKHTVLRAIMNALYYSGAHRLFQARYGGIGSLLMFHRVRPEPDLTTFVPNRSLEVTPDYFENVVQLLLGSGYRIVDMSEALRRLAANDHSERFAVLTFDDGYRDNYEFGLPICRKYGVPMVVYITTGLIDRISMAWWLGLEEILRKSTSLAFQYDGQAVSFDTSSNELRREAFVGISNLMRSLSLANQERLATHLMDRFGVDFRALTDEAFMNWDEVRTLAGSGYAEIGGHTVHHPQLASLPADLAMDEMREGADILAEKLGQPIHHFAYPFGGRPDAGAREFSLAGQLGFGTAVTGRQGNVMPEHSDHVYALPRLTVSGWHQTRPAMQAMLSGAIPALVNRFRRIVTA